MVQNYVVREITIQGPQIPGNPGIQADTYLDSGNPTTIRGGSQELKCGVDADGHDPDWAFRMLFHITNILNSMKVKADDIMEITLHLLAFNNMMDRLSAFAVSSIDEGPWDESITTWDNRLAMVEWEEKGGKSTASRPSYSKLFDFSSSGWQTFYITEYKDKDEFDILIYRVPDEDGVEGETTWMAFESLQFTVINARPYVKFKFREWSVDAFSSQDDKLTVIPYSENPERPQLKWGKIGNWDRYTATKIYRKTTAFSKPSEGTLVATINDITRTTWEDPATLTDGQQYFYMVSVEGTYNLLDDSTYTNLASFVKPDITTLTLSPVGPYTVGQSISIAVGSPQNIKKVWVDWKDGTQSWYEFDTVATSQTVSHYFSSVITAQTPDVRIQDEKGFWSGLTTAPAITTDDANPIAKLVVNEKSVIESEIVALSGVFSQPMGSNATITKYEFTVNGGGSWIDNTTNPVYLFDTTGYIGTNILGIRITTSTGKVVSSIGTTLQVVSGTPEELIFSQHTKVEEISHSLSLLKEEKTPIGSEGIEYDYLLARRPDIITVSMSTSTPHLEADLNIVRDAWENDKFIRIKTRAEFETKEITYDGTFVGDIEMVQQFQGVVVWNFRLKVINRTEAFIPGKSGVITAVASGGSGLLTITSANHGLVADDEIYITGTTSYNGGNLVASVISSSQFRVRGTYSTTQTGSWMKKSYANQN